MSTNEETAAQARAAEREWSLQGTPKQVDMGTVITRVNAKEA